MLSSTAETVRHLSRTGVFSDRQTIFTSIINAGGSFFRTDMPAGFQVDNGGRTQTRIAITRIGPNALPWKFKVPELATSPPTSPLPSPKYTPEFAQIQDFDISRPDFQFEISCEKWWYRKYSVFFRKQDFLLPRIGMQQ